MKKIFSTFIFVLHVTFIWSQTCCVGTGCNTFPSPSQDNNCIGCKGGPTSRGSIDPNDLIPPDAIGDKGWIRRDKDLPFTLLFENLPLPASLPSG